MATPWSDRDHDEQNDARYHDELRLLETELALTEVAIRAGLILNETMARVWESERGHRCPGGSACEDWPPCDLRDDEEPTGRTIEPEEC